MHPRLLVYLPCCALLLLATAVSSAGDTPQQRARVCAAIDAQYQRLEARMRAGYGARGSERLWDQRRQLRVRRWAWRCHDLRANASAPARGAARP